MGLMRFIYLFTVAILFSVAFSDDQCFSNELLAKTVAGMEKITEEMQLYDGIEKCFKNKIQDLPIDRQFTDSDSDSSDDGSDDQVRCYSRAKLDEMLKSCARATGDLDESERFARLAPPRKGSYKTRLKSVVRQRRCTQTYYCCTTPSILSSQLRYCLRRNGCSNLNICRR